MNVIIFKLKIRFSVENKINYYFPCLCLIWKLNVASAPQSTDLATNKLWNSVIAKCDSQVPRAHLKCFISCHSLRCSSASWMQCWQCLQTDSTVESASPPLLPQCCQCAFLETNNRVYSISSSGAIQTCQHSPLRTKCNNSQIPSWISNFKCW